MYYTMNTINEKGDTKEKVFTNKKELFTHINNLKEPHKLSIVITDPRDEVFASKAVGQTKMMFNNRG